MAKKTIFQIKESQRVLVVNANKDEVISTGLFPFGYTSAKLAYGLNLFEEVDVLFEKKEDEYVEKKELTNQINESREELEGKYKVNLKLAKLALRNEPTLLAMLPYSIEFTVYEEWSKSTKDLYSLIKKNTLVQELMADFGVEPSVADLELDRLRKIEVLIAERTRKFGSAQSITQERDKKWNELEDYCRVLKQVAKIAFAENPQVLEKLGILVRNN